MKYFLPIFFILSAARLSAQTESVHLHMDKTICYPGDTVWFRGSIFENNYPSTLSTNLYVELYNDSNKLCVRKTFPIISSMSIGQLELPKRSGLYWVRSYTRNSSFYLQSLTIRARDRAVVIRKLLDDKSLPAILDTCGLFFNTVNTPKGISCTIIPDSSSKYNGKPFKLVMKNYDSNAGEYTFTLNKYRQRNILINKDSVRGYLTLLFYNSDTLVARQDIFVPQKRDTNLVTITKDGDGYDLNINDTGNWNYSLAVVRDTLPDNQNTILNCLSLPGKKTITDTTFLAYQGRVSQNSGQHSLVKNRDLVVMFENDSAKETRLIHVDSAGKISLSGLYFFDTTYLHYRLNGKEQEDESSDVQLSLASKLYPEFIVPDSTSYEYDTLNVPVTADFPTFDTVDYLPLAKVSQRWSDRNKALDTRYTTGRFSNPSYFSFDLLHADTKYDCNLIDYLKKELPGFREGCINENSRCTFRGMPIVFYLNEEVVNWRDIPTHLNEIAYVKILEDFIEDDRYIRMVSDIPCDSSATFLHPRRKAKDNSPAAMICVYTRGNKDFGFLPGEMTTLAMKGYSRPFRWETKDKNTLLWVPYINQHIYTFTIDPSDAYYFKVIVEAVNKYGETTNFEEIIDQNEKYLTAIKCP